MKKNYVNLLIFVVLFLILGMFVLKNADMYVKDSQEEPDLVIDFDSAAEATCGQDSSLPLLTQQDKRYLIDVSYRAVSDFFNTTSFDKGIFLEKYDNISNKAFISFRVEGLKRGSWSAQKNNLAETVYRATINTLQDNRYKGQLEEEASSKLKIEIFVLGQDRQISVDSIEKFEEDFEKGFHGIKVIKNDRSATFYNSVQKTGNYNTKNLLTRLCNKAGFEDSCYENDEVDVMIFDTLHFMNSRFSEDVVTLYRSDILHEKEDINAELLKNSLTLAENWIYNNVDEGGKITYQYSPSNGKYSTGNNMIRQFMASFVLSKSASDDENILELNKRNLGYNLEKFYAENQEGYGMILFNRQVKLGALGLAVLSIGDSPFYEENKEKVDKLTKTILKLQNEDGSFEPFFIHPTGDYDKENFIRFYAGESMLALAKLYKKTNDKKYLDAVINAADFYPEHVWENYDPAYVPWMTLAFYELYDLTKDEKYAKVVFELNDELIKIQNKNVCPYPDLLGRFYDPAHPEYGQPFSASTAIYTEGVAYAYDLAKQFNDTKRMESYKESTLLGALNLINLQFEGANMFYLNHPERVEGAIRYRVSDNRIRIDTTQHTVEAFRSILKFVNEEEIKLI